MSTVQLAILLDEETLRARTPWTAINFLRALRDGSPGMLWNCARQFNFRHTNQKSKIETLTNPDFRACARLIADAVPEILYFLPGEEARDFVYLLCSCDIAERDGDPKLVVTIAPEELKAQLFPLMVGMRAAIVKASFPEDEIIRQSINVLEWLQVPSAQRGACLRRYRDFIRRPAVVLECLADVLVYLIITEGHCIEVLSVCAPEKDCVR